MKKKSLLTITILLLILALGLTGCGSSGGGRNEEDQMDAEAGATTEDDSLYDEGDETVIYSAYAGMKIDTPTTYILNQDKVFIYHVGGKASEGLLEMMVFLYPNSYGELMTMSEEDFAKSESLAINGLNIYRASGDWTLEKVQEHATNIDKIDGSKVFELKKVEDETIYVFSNMEYSDDVPSDIASLFDTILRELADNAYKVEITAPIEYEDDLDDTEIEETAYNFKTTYVDDDTEVTSEDLFSGNKYTMVNAWTSWCGYCVKEMPELEEMNKELQENGCGVVGILFDADTENGLADAQEIIKETGVTYPMVIATDEMKEMFNVYGYPTTFFVDSQGNEVADSVAGARLSAYRKTMEELLG